jgi:hypothetical protein
MAAGDLVVPAGQWHLEWDGMLLGWPGSAWTLTDLSGWLTLPDSINTNINREGRWGSIAGLQTFGTRTVEATFTYTDYGDIDTLEPLRRALTPVEDPQEQPLVVWAGTANPEIVYARIDKAAIPSPREFSMGLHTVTVSWLATDPRRYSLDEQQVQVALPYKDPAAGLHFPLHFDTLPPSGAGLEFGTARGGGTGIVDNDGPLPVWPTFTITGPVDSPAVSLVGGTGALATAAGFSIPAGQALLLDTANFYPAQGNAGTDPDTDPSWIGRNDKLTVRNWFPLPPGRSAVLFTSMGVNPDAVLTIAWRSAALL